MQTCTQLIRYGDWFMSRLVACDPDINRTTKPDNMSDAKWKDLLAHKKVFYDWYTSQGKAAAEFSPKLKDGETEASVLQDICDIINKWEYYFNRHLQLLLDALNHYAATETVVLLSLCARLSTANQGTEAAGNRQSDDLDV